MNNYELILEYTKNLNVLYVEDDVSLREDGLLLFQTYFKIVDIAADGEIGFSKYEEFEKENGFFYDLIITDIQMPKLNGLCMSEKILKKNPVQSIMILTAFSENKFLRTSIELGVNAFLSKPLNIEHFEKSLYKTSKAISDHKFVESHVDMIEELNLKLESQNRELYVKNQELEKSFRMLDTVLSKEKLSSPQNRPLVVEKEKVVDSNKYQLEQIEELVSNDLYELREILTEIDVNVIRVINSYSREVLEESVVQIIKFFSKYSSVLGFYNFFNELSSSMATFSHTLENNEIPQNEENIKNVFMLLESFIYVLGKWHDDISSGEENKLNQFDASIISDMHTITNMWTQKDEEFTQDDMDDIFDF